MNFMEDSPSAGAAGPSLLNTDGTLQTSTHPMTTAFREFWHLFHLDLLHRLSTYDLSLWGRSQPHLVDVVSGACMCLRRAALDQVGLLNEQYFMYAEEVDICYRLARLGWQVWWVPQAEVVHLGGASATKVSDEMLVQLYRSKHRFICQSQGRAVGEAFKAALLLASFVRVMAGLIAGMIPGVDHKRVRVKAHQYRRLLQQIASFRV
jgi:N-acetylglucosaminyl-diphospho-decaprenol L-rhamnosyltransferase